MKVTTATVVNGKQVECEHDVRDSAVDVIRKELGLTGTKLVCGAGVCGACTVRIEGRPTASCVTPACSLEGKRVETIEHHGADQLHPVQKAFLAHDGLQCGFCTPGFIVEAISFYEDWRARHGTLRPDREQVAAAMAGHLCRCGAYVGIYDAIGSACAGEFDDVDQFEFPRHEGIAKVTGTAKYAVDVHYEGMLVAKLLGSPHAHARVKSIDWTQAEGLPGVVAVIEVLDDPHRKVRYVGQPIAAVAAANESAAYEAIHEIKIEYEVLPFVVDRAEAHEPDAAVVYPEKKKQPANASEGPIPPGSWDGNIRTPVLNKLLSTKKRQARTALRDARGGRAGLHLIERTFSTPAQTHTALEPHVCVANWNGEHLTVHTSTQSVHLLGKEIAKHFRVPREKVTVHAEYIGGAFGAKQGFILEQRAAIELARKSGAPVKLAYTREEEMVLGGFRPEAQIELSLVVDNQGNQRGITARAHGYCGTAVQSQNAPWIRFLYKGPKDVEDFDVTTNWGSARPFRGPCGPSAFWALEQAVDEAAETTNIDPIALRRQWEMSDVRDGLYDWIETIPEWRLRKPAASGEGRFRTGIGFAVGNWFNAFWNGARVQLDASATGLVARCAVQDMGQGSRSVIGKAIADELNVPQHTIDVAIGNSNYVPGPISSGSRTTASIFPTAIEAAQMMRDKLVDAARSTLGWTEATWVRGGIQHHDRHVPLAELLAHPKLPDLSVTSNKRGSNGLFDLVGKLPSGDLGMNFALKMTGSVCLAKVNVDTRLGRIRTDKVWMGMSVGKITNPALARSQSYGSVIQSLGLTLTEERQWDPTTGTLLSFNMEDYRIPGIGDTPEIELYFDETRFDDVMKFGVSGMSELSTLPISAAVGNAVYNATGWRPTELPLRPHRVLPHVRNL